jgi:hypothetical protein
MNYLNIINSDVLHIILSKLNLNELETVEEIITNDINYKILVQYYNNKMYIDIKRLTLNNKKIFKMVNWYLLYKQHLSHEEKKHTLKYDYQITSSMIGNDFLNIYDDNNNNIWYLSQIFKNYPIL